MILSLPSKVPAKATVLVPIGVHAIPARLISAPRIMVLSAKLFSLASCARPSNSAAVSMVNSNCSATYQLVSAVVSSAAYTLAAFQGIRPMTITRATAKLSSLFNIVFICFFLLKFYLLNIKTQINPKKQQDIACRNSVYDLSLTKSHANA